MSRKTKMAIIYLIALALLFPVAYIVYNYEKYHPMFTSSVKIVGDTLVIDSAADVIVVINGRIIGPVRHYELRLNGSNALVELWYKSDVVYRYLIYRDINGYSMLWHYYRRS